MDLEAILSECRGRGRICSERGSDSILSKLAEQIEPVIDQVIQTCPGDSR